MTWRAGLAALLMMVLAVPVVGWARDGWEVLSAKDVAAYKRLMKEARAGEKPVAADLKGLENPLLKGHVQAEFLLGRHKATYAELGEFLKEHPDLPQATRVYDQAENIRPGPKRVCKKVPQTRKVAIKHKSGPNKGKPTGKFRTVKRTVNDCKMVGSWAPLPPKPAVLLAREARRAALATDNDRALAQLGPDGRRLSGQIWRVRQAGNHAQALTLLLEPGARADLGSARWQGELVRLADVYHGRQDWRNVGRAAAAAAEVPGPLRDEARWLAGMAAYELGQKRAALALWQALVEDEPQASATGGVFGKHFARAAWWAARVAETEGNRALAERLLRLGARDQLSFYGQLSAARVANRAVALDWKLPSVTPEQLAMLKRVPAVQRALALVQLGERNLAQEEFRLADDEIPYQATPALAALAVELKLPATALVAGRQLRERGEVLPAALYPLPKHWQPTGGWATERALVYGIMRQESAFYPTIGSRVGAQGLMQIMPATGRYIARMQGRAYNGKADLHDPATNMAMAQHYLNYLHGKLDGNMLFVVAAYNGGIGNVQRWLARGITPGDDPVRWLEMIPFDETRDYVEKVLANYWIYQQRLGEHAWSLEALAQGNWPQRWAAVPDAKPES